MKPLRLLVPGVGLALTACASFLGRAPWAWPQPKPTPSPAEIVERLRVELIPDLDAPTGYGPAFNRAGYTELLEWNKSITPVASWADDYEATDITLPCCQAARPNRDETKNCGCGHHQALYGASKTLLLRGFDLARVQAEVDRWKAVFFPKETLLAELERRSLTDPAYREALDQLKPQGLC